MLKKFNKIILLFTLFILIFHIKTFAISSLQKIELNGNYKELHVLNENLLIVNTDNEDEYKIINLKEENLNNKTYTSFGDSKFSEGLLPCVRDDKTFYIDEIGKEVFSFNGLGLGFSDGLAAVCDITTKKWGFIDTSGNLVIDCKYDFAENFDNGISVVKTFSNEEPYGIKLEYINKLGETIYSNSTIIMEYSEGLAIIKENDKYGFINSEGEIVIECKYDTADPFHNGIARVGLNNQSTYINKQGNTLFSFDDGAERFYSGLLEITDNDFYGYVDKSGNKVFEITYNIPDSHVDLPLFSDGYTFACRNGKFIIVNTSGQETNLKYKEDDIFSIDNHNGIMIFTYNDRDKGDVAINMNGDEILSSDLIEFTAPNNNYIISTQYNDNEIEKISLYKIVQSNEEFIKPSYSAENNTTTKNNDSTNIIMIIIGLSLVLLSSIVLIKLLKK